MDAERLTVERGSGEGAGPLRITPMPGRPDAAHPFNPPTPGWEAMTRELEERMPRIRRRFLFSTNLGAFGAMLGAGWAILELSDLWAPTAQTWWVVLAALLPSALLGVAAGHAMGGLALSRATGWTSSRRRMYALRLGASRTPSHWPGYVARWLFTGDWMAEPCVWDKAPYLRAFVTGERAPEELEPAWWDTILQQLDGRGGLPVSSWEPGATHFEMGYTDALPQWTRGMADGSTLAYVTARTGESARSWSRHFWRRATLRLAGLGDPSVVEEGAFRFYKVRLDDVREALVVTLDPAASPGESPERVLRLVDATERRSA